MANLPLPLSAETVSGNARVHAGTVPRTDPPLLLAGLGDPTIVDFVTFAARKPDRKIAVISSREICQGLPERARAWPLDHFSGEERQWNDIGKWGLVLFLNRQRTPLEQALIDKLAGVLAGNRGCRLCIVSSFRVHWGDKQATEAEAYALARLQKLAARTVVFRPSHILSPGSRSSKLLRSLWFCHPLIPKHCTGCSLDGQELFDAIENEVTQTAPSPASIYTLLGPNRPWRTLLQNHRQAGLLGDSLALGARLLALMGIGALTSILLRLFMRLVPRLRRWNVATLYPLSVRELLALYNKYNFPYVKIVGYNNGIVHFGQHYPGQTVVSTVRCNQVSRVHGQRATFDAGVTLRQANEALARAGKEFYVLPNYSFVSVGTGFFIRIHGSAGDYSTMAETLERVTLYDPVSDRLIMARRQDPAFGHYLYNLHSDILLLRARFRVKEKSFYYRKSIQLENPSSQELLRQLCDHEASNVEIRKARSASKAVEVAKYYTQPPDGASALPFPKDSIGRLWDRLEANPVLSYLFHALTRRLAYHVELFFTAEEFAVFWQTHGSLPIAKLQLRYLKRDGFPHSPFRRCDCISADLFMLRRHRQAFLAYIKENFCAVQFNPGKHSM